MRIRGNVVRIAPYVVWSLVALGAGKWSTLWGRNEVEPSCPGPPVMGRGSGARAGEDRGQWREQTSLKTRRKGVEDHRSSVRSSPPVLGFSDGGVEWSSRSRTRPQKVTPPGCDARRRGMGAGDRAEGARLGMVRPRRRPPSSMEGCAA